MRGHVNNVSCVIFHPKKEVIISNSGQFMDSEDLRFVVLAFDFALRNGLHGCCEKSCQ